VTLQPLPPSDPLSSVRNEQNAAVIEWDDGVREIVRGHGAGRRPSAQAVLRDLLELAEQDRRCAHTIESAPVALTG
jgi:homoserine dehydrogenase